MGQDIHVWIEEKRPVSSYPELVGLGAWKIVGGNWWEHTGDPDGDDYDEVEKDYGPTYTMRNYCLFGLLAGTGRFPHVTPIAEPRGLPHDVHPEIKKCSDQWDIDGHTHSWLTYGELKSFDWSQGLELDNEVGPKVYQYWLKTGDVKILSYAAAGLDAGLISNGQMKKWIERNLPDLDDSPEKPDTWELHAKLKTKVTWFEPWSSVCEEFTKFLEYLDTFENPEDLRIVFWFDN